MASAFIPVVGQERYGRMLRGASGALGKAGVRAKVGVASGLVGAGLVEPLIAGSEEIIQADYGMVNSLMNLTFGSIMGGVSHPAGGGAGEFIIG